MRGLRSDIDPTVDDTSNTREMDHDQSWVCNALLCGHVNGVDHISRSTTRAILYGAIDYGAIHYRAIHYGLSAVDYVMQEVKYIDRRYAAVDLANG